MADEFHFSIVDARRSVDRIQDELRKAGPTVPRAGREARRYTVQSDSRPEGAVDTALHRFNMGETVAETATDSAGCCSTPPALATPALGAESRQAPRLSLRPARAG